jgi:hypothetical protein
MSYERSKRHHQSVKKKKPKKASETIDSIFTKDTASLLQDYQKILERIADINSVSLRDLTMNTETKYFLIQNDLDYSIFRECIKSRRMDFIEYI